MAKMKVHELAKELGMQSKEVVAFLQDKGYEVKAAQSSIEDEAIALVRGQFGQKPEGEIKEKPVKDKAEVKVSEAKRAETKVPEEKKDLKPKAPEAARKAGVAPDSKPQAPKKKKNIIFVSNPHNSKMPGGGSAQGGARRPAGSGQRPVSSQSAPHKIIRPTQKPIPVTAEPYDVRQRQQQERRIEQRRQQEGRENANVQNKTGSQEKQYQNSNANNRRNESAGRQNFTGRQGGNYNTNASAGSGRSFSGNERFQKGNVGQDNKFKRGGNKKDFMPESPIKEAEKHRDEEKRRINQERDRRSKKDLIYEEDEMNGKNRNKAGRFIKPEKKSEAAVEEKIKVITLPETMTIKELADKMKIQPSVIIKKLFMQGQIVTVNSEITFEDAENIAIEYEIICEKEEKVDVIEELLKEEEEDASKMNTRPPVICVMGHVDHGKTSLLDAIRKTNVTDKEAGGITQAIGAYTVQINGQKITFLDTPGHEAFTAMRMRGANATDIAILVVAADDGVMPQTVEAINHAKAAGIEIVVAVNKIDKPNANIDRVKQEMTEYELIPVDWGGSTEFVPVSAKSGEGLDTLLETILLTAEILELKANPDRNARGLVIEAELDKGRGPVATVLVQKGTLHVGDFISAGASHGKVRAMIDDKGRRVKEALPSTPVEILGLSDVPSAGEVFIVHENDKTAKSYAETYMAQHTE